jgi:hypothetical protein
MARYLVRRERSTIERVHVKPREINPLVTDVARRRADYLHRLVQSGADLEMAIALANDLAAGHRPVGAS